MTPLRSLLATAASGLALLGATAAGAQSAAPPPAASAPAAPAPAAAPQVVEPQVARRELRLPKYPSRDVEIGLFTGYYSTQNFGRAAVSGVRLGYHITEDFFVTGQYGVSKIDDEVFRRFGLGNVLNSSDRDLKYLTLAVGYNLLPGEVFFGRSNARLSQGYILAGAGSTHFAGQRKQTVDLGFGLKLLFGDRFSVHTEVRDHAFAIDLLGKRETQHNTEIHFGLSVYF